MKDQDIVKIIFKEKIYRGHPWIIPIVQTGNHKFNTGQKLSYRKMIGEEDLTTEEAEMYPHVINPHDYLKLMHGKKYDRIDPVSKSLLNLAVLSGKMAPSLAAYEETPVKFVGYIEDTMADSLVYNKKQDERYEAETAVRNSSISDYRRIALIINYKMAKNIKVASSSSDYVKAEILKAVDENPHDVLQCFPQYNPDITRDIYILELISYKVLTKLPNGEIYDGDVFVGANLSSAKNFMSVGSNAPIIDKWKKKLDVKKGLASESVLEKLDTSHSDSRVDEYKKLVLDTKSAIVDDNPKGAEFFYNSIIKDYPELLDDITSEHLLTKINELKGKIRKSIIDKKIEEFKASMKDLDIEKVRNKITIKTSKYKKEDCDNFWDDKEKIIDYMVKVKFDN